MTATADALRELLSGGDRRSQALSHLALERVRGDRRGIERLARLTADEDWLVAMRALDLLEKLAHEDPASVEAHKHVFLGELADSDKWEIRLQVVRALPLFHWTAKERRRAVAILARDVEFPQSFVRAWALDGLATFADADPALRPGVERHLQAFERSGLKSLQARARRIRERRKGRARSKAGR